MKLGNRRCLLFLVSVVFSASGFAQDLSNPGKPALPERSSAVAKGIVIETVKDGSVSQEARMQAGDVLLSWIRGEASGQLESPFDLSWVEIEQAPRGTVTIQGLRGNSQQVWVLQPGIWGVDTRPHLSEALLGRYVDAQRLAASGKLANAIDGLRALSQQVHNSAPPWLESWFLFHAADLWARNQQWKESDAIYEELTALPARPGLTADLQILRTWASAFEQRGDWKSAQKRYRLMMDDQNEMSTETILWAEALAGVGNMNCLQGDLDSGEKMLQRAAEIQSRLAPGSLVLAKRFSEIANLAFLRGDVSKREEYLERALAIRAKLASNTLDLASTLNNLGSLRIESDPREASEYLSRARILEEHLAPASGLLARTLLSLGKLSFEQGNLNEAENYNGRALEIGKKLNSNSLLVASSLMNLGNVAASRGDLVAAERYYLAAVGILEKIPTGKNWFAPMIFLGRLAEARGDWSKAEKYFQKGLTNVEEHSPRLTDRASLLCQLGDVARQQGKLAEAEDYYRSALAVQEKMGPSSLDLAQILANLGLVFSAREDFVNAYEFQEHALGIREELVPGSLFVAESLTALGDVARDRGDLDEAEEHYRKALAIWEDLSPWSMDNARTLIALAGILSRRQRSDEAVSLFERAMNVLDRQMDHFGGGENTRSTFRANNSSYYHDYVDLLMRRNTPEKAFDVLERSRARTMLEMLATAHIDVHRGVDPALLARERSLKADINAKVDRRIRLQTGKHTEGQVAEVNRGIEALLEQLRDVESQIRLNNPSYAALTQPQSVNARELEERLLDDDTVLLEYSLGEERSYLWAVTRNSLKAFLLPKRAEIEIASRKVYSLLSARHGLVRESHSGRWAKTETDDPKALAALSRMVLGPVAADISGKRLVIVAEGALQYIPFAALPEPRTAGASKPAAPLVVHHEIVSLPSASVLVELRREKVGRQEAAKAVAVLADPVFNNDDARVRQVSSVRKVSNSPTRGLEAESIQEESNTELGPGERLTRSLEDVGLRSAGGLSRLRFSRLEAQAIMTVTPKGSGRAALDFNASREMATSPELAQYRIVHFATHGLLDNEHPELSGLVLSLVDEHGKDKKGFLDLEDIYNLNLPADLVVLSACETALGKEIQGEGLIGLTRGFMYAGASRVVASLWKVDDVATAELMGRFYKGMEKGGFRPAAALRQAQIEMSKQKEWSAPYYWAAFQMQGEWK